MLFKLQIKTTQKFDTSQETEGHKKTYKFTSTTLSSIDKDMTKFLINLKDSTLDNSFNMFKSSEKEYSRDRGNYSFVICVVFIFVLSNFDFIFNLLQRLSKVKL